MRLNSVWSSVLALSAVIGLSIWAAIEEQSRGRLEQEHQALEQQMEQMAALAASNAQMSNLLAQANSARTSQDEQELLRLRGEVGLLRRQTREFAAVRNENREARAALDGSRKGQSARAANAVATADYWPRDSWGFSGYASPDAAMQSSLWAANNGDVKALWDSVTGDVRNLIEAEVKGKSEDEASARVMDHVIGLKSVRIINRETQGEDAAVLTAEFESGADTQTGKLLMKKVDNQWKLAGLPQ